MISVPRLIISCEQRLLVVAEAEARGYRLEQVARGRGDATWRL